MSTVSVSLPPLFVAVTVYVTPADDSSVGVPVITPLELLNDKPAGSAGLMAQLTTSPPPVTDGVLAEMAVPTVYVALAVPYDPTTDTAARTEKHKHRQPSETPQKAH